MLRSQLPPGSSAPAFIQLLEAILSPLDSLDRSAQCYGDRFTSRLAGQPPTVIVSHPRDLQRVFEADPTSFDIGRGNRILHPLMGDTSIVLLNGSPHRRQRKLLTPPFHGDRMRTYGDTIAQITRQVIDRPPLGQTFSVRRSMQEISLQVILQTIFGVDDCQRFAALHHHLTEMLDLFGTPLFSSFLFVPALQQDWGRWSPWGKFLRHRQAVDQLIYAEIADRELAERTRQQHSDTKRTDILALLMAAQDETGAHMTPQELRDELMTLLIAGHETTATALTWALYWLHSYPQTLNELLAELPASAATWDQLVKLPYLDAIVKETLRLYPVAMFAFMRVLERPFQLGSIELPPGVQIAPCIYLLHHQPDLYPHSRKFSPERFLQQRFGPYDYLPFGGGDRRCIGLAFVHFEMKLVLATLFEQWRFQLQRQYRPRAARRGVALAPAFDLKLMKLQR